jgi:hypothetical protein
MFIFCFSFSCILCIFNRSLFVLSSFFFCSVCFLFYDLRINSVAVSSGEGSTKCITMIDIESQEVMRTISMDTDIHGLAVRARTIYYCARKNGLKMLSLSDQSISAVINNKYMILFYLHLSVITLLHLYS